MRVLLDENVDRRLKKSFDDDFEITTVTERGWSGKKNGELLRAAEREFDALVAMDRNMEHQQNLGSVALGVVLISASSNRRRDVEPIMPEVNRALRRVRAGELTTVTAS
jgi:predicted nuclease of predicted toxin-antitoxin system